MRSNPPPAEIPRIETAEVSAGAVGVEADVGTAGETVATGDPNEVKIADRIEVQNEA
jgi:hypothetical protein